MSCYHPNKMVWTGNWTESLKKEYKMIPKEIADKLTHLTYEMIEVPCGKCLGCRLDYSKQWANRCMWEAKQYKENYFITLTYSDEFLPKSQGVINYETGEVGETATLKPEDFTQFMKKIRRHWEYKYNWKKIEADENTLENAGIRFYGCGEYGSQKERPHYHIIMYNFPIQDLKYWYTASNGTRIYTSEEIKRIWGKGIVAICEVCWETCAYVARYVMKKQKGKEAVEKFLDSGRVQEFVRMSRNPGIARDYYEENKDKIYEHDEVFIKNNKGIHKAKPPRYYDKIYDIENHEKMENIKRHRKVVTMRIEKSEYEETGIEKLKRLQLKEDYKLKVTKQLKRTL